MFSLEVERITQVLPIHNSATTNESLSAGKLIVLTGPSGVGKGTLIRSLLQRYPELYLSISVTTRFPRLDEINGKDYYFVSHSDFEQMVANNELLEWAEFAGNYYGTPRLPVQQQISHGKWVLLEIELEGARQISKTFPSARRIFILPPSLTELEHRLRDRGQDSQSAIGRRLHRAQEEVNAASEFDIQIINDDLEIALNQLKEAIFS